MTFEQLKAKLKIQNPPVQHNPDACAYGKSSQGDPWDDEDEIAWLAGYSQYHQPAPKVDDKTDEKAVVVISDADKKEMDHFWQALILLAECRGAIETLLQLDLRKDFLSPAAHKDLSDLQSNVEDLIDQYDVASIAEG